MKKFPSRSSSSTISLIETHLMCPDEGGNSSSQEDAQFRLFKELCSVGNLIPMYRRVMTDQLTPVLAYNCLVSEDDRNSPSFLLESIYQGEFQGRYSFIGSQPILEVLAEGNRVTVLDHAKGTRTVSEEVDPMEVRIEHTLGGSQLVAVRCHFSQTNQTDCGVHALMESWHL